jgi:hypothetical protein
MVEGLSASFESVGDAMGKLIVRVRANGFSGCGAAWFRETELIEFTQALVEDYPFPAERKHRLRGGY